MSGCLPAAGALLRFRREAKQLKIRKVPSLAFEEAKARVGALRIGASLAVAGGFLDGFTYVGHGHVFANAMTGNVVLLGLSFVTKSWYTAFRHVTPILAFLLGIWVSQALQLRPKRNRYSPPYLSVLLTEILILLGLSVLPANTNSIVFTTTVSFISSVQVSTFREVNGRNYSSTFTTGNLRTLSEGAFSWFFEGRKRESARVVQDFATICTSFLLGAASGGFATQAFGNHALWWDIGLFILITMLVQHSLRIPFETPRNG